MRSGLPSRLAQTLGINSVPIVGVFVGDWSTATTLVVYWSETFLAALFAGTRILIHRRVTRKKGHYRDRWEKSSQHLARKAKSPRRFQTFLSGFLTGSLILTFGLGLFLALLLGTVLDGSTNLESMKSGVFWMAMVQVAAFCWDLNGIRARPFAWVREAADDVMGRIALIHLGMQGGMFVMAWLGQPPAFFGTFAVMKLAADIVGLAARRGSAGTPPHEPPAWAAWISARADPGGDLRSSWREHLDRQRAMAEEDEEVMPSSELGARKGA